MRSSPASIAVGVALGALAGCGEDTAAATCAPGGFADGETTLQAAPLGPFDRASQVALPASALGTTSALVFAEAAGACGEPAATGRSLALLLCEPPTERTYLIVARSQFRCPGDNVLALVEGDGGVDVTTGTGGLVRVEQAGACVTGTYSVALGSDLLEGAFDAEVCAAP